MVSTDKAQWILANADFVTIASRKETIEKIYAFYDNCCTLYDNNIFCYENNSLIVFDSMFEHWKILLLQYENSVTQLPQLKKSNMYVCGKIKVLTCADYL